MTIGHALIGFVLCFLAGLVVMWFRKNMIQAKLNAAEAKIESVKAAVQNGIEEVKKVL